MELPKITSSTPYQLQGSGGIDFAVYPRLIKLIKIEDNWIIQEYGSMSRPYPLPEFVEGESEFPEVEEQAEEPS